MERKGCWNCNETACTSPHLKLKLSSHWSESWWEVWGARFKIEYWPGLDLLIRWGLWRGESLIVTVWQCDSPSDISYLSSHLSQNKNYTEFLITESCWDLCVNWTAIICHGNFELIRLQTKRLELRIIWITNHWLITDPWYENVSAYLKARNVPSAVWYLCHVPVSCPEVLGTRDWPGLSVIYQCEELAFINQTTATTSNPRAHLLCIPHSLDWQARKITK